MATDFNTIVQLAGIIDDLIKKVPDYVDNVIKAETYGVFKRLPQRRRNPQFWVTWKIAGGGAVQGFDLDSTASQLGEVAIPRTVQGSDELYTIVGQHRVTKKAIMDSANNDYMIKNLAAEIIDGVAQRIKDAIVRLWYLPERNVLAKYTVGGSNETISTSGSVIVFNEYPYAWFLKINDIVEVYNGTTKLGVAVVDFVDDDRKTVTFKAIGSDITLPASATVKFYFQNLTDAVRPFNSYPFIASTNRTIHGVDSSTYKMFNGTVLDGTSYTGGLSIEAVEAIKSIILNLPYGFKLGDYKVAYTTDKQLKNLRGDMLASGVYMVDLQKTMEYGTWGLVVDETTFEFDQYVPPGQVFMPSVEYLELAVGDKDWVTQDGSRLIRWSTEQFNIYAAIQHADYQFATDNPPAQARIYNLPGDFY